MPRALRFWSTPRRGSNAAIPTCSAPPSSTASRWVFISRRSWCAMRGRTASRFWPPTSISAIGIARWNKPPPSLPRKRGREGGGHAVRLGFRIIGGLAENELEKLIAARGNGFSSIERLAAIAGVSRFTIERLAEADAFRSLGLDRRAALWAARRLDVIGISTARSDRQRQNRGSAAAAGAAFERRAFSRAGRGAAGNAALRARRGGLRGDRPVAEGASRGLLPRPPRRARRARNAALRSSLNCSRTRRTVTVAGLVLVRQRPGTSKGVVFMTLEDETDIANIIVWPKVFAKNRRTVMTARFLAVRGRLQRAGSVIHVVAESFVDLSTERQCYVKIGCARAATCSRRNLPAARCRTTRRCRSRAATFIESIPKHIPRNLRRFLVPSGRPRRYPDRRPSCPPPFPSANSDQRSFTTKRHNRG